MHIKNNFFLKFLQKSLPTKKPQPIIYSVCTPRDCRILNAEELKGLSAKTRQDSGLKCSHVYIHLKDEGNSFEDTNNHRYLTQLIPGDSNNGRMGPHTDVASTTMISTDSGYATPFNLCEKPLFSTPTC